MTAPLPKPAAVLDTNVLLDWLVFGDAQGRRLGEAVTAGRLHWAASPAMEDEMAEVLRRGLPPPWEDAGRGWRDAWRRHADLRPQPAPDLARPRCRDADDQKFVDFAVVHRVRWLISRDKALLALRRRLRPLGVAVVTPDEWLAHEPPVA
ncbi:putative toxin-antitoxin system toxin component, PIN family [Aquabacterium sp. J223]|uniref:PIN domain-containing protein n=1 Tax=Aquabacterium sp. J223 TaxID=2898431 RepID=UPI0021AD884E|nr:PIN domain-containing protein [Aquabacterium sp. J223]UUX96363.1 PIN domain-containing protein [Aquabacterium sp. J223]